MRCSKANRYIHLGLDGELSPRQSAALSRHMDGCASCSRLQRELAILHTASARLGQRHSESSTQPHSIRLIRSAHHRVRWAVAMGLAAALAFAVVAFKWIKHSPNQPELIVKKNTEPQERAEPHAPIAPRVRVELAADVDSITVQHPTHRSNITLMWIYPTVKSVQASTDSSEPLDSSSQGA